MSSIVRFLQPGQGPQNIHCSLDATAGDIFAQAGGGSVPEGSALSVNGIQAGAETPVKAGDTVQLQPKALHG